MIHGFTYNLSCIAQTPQPVANSRLTRRFGCGSDPRSGIGAGLGMAVVALTMQLTPVVGHAQADFCPAPEFVYQGGAQFAFDPDAPVEAFADSIESDGDIVTLSGESEIVYQNRRILAENARYNSVTGEVEIDGDLSYESDGIRLKSNAANLDLGGDTFSLGESSYEVNLGDKSASGSASSMARLDDGLFRLTEATYSTCPPGDRSWFIRADSIVLDTEEGVGTANKITLNFKGVPLLAVPTFSFPISPKRKTGFLAPIIASNDSTGIELHIPWYWNIRPNLDATFTPRIMSKRGTQLQVEARYLNRLGEWTLDTEYLYDDNQPSGQRERRFTRIKHTGQLNDPRWKTSLDASSVSDKTYFEDLGDSLSIASITHLERRADLTYEDDRYRFLTRLQSFQTVDADIAPEGRPYQRLPQIVFDANYDDLKNGLEASFNAELVNFERAGSVTGVRLDMKPVLSWPIDRDSWFFNPTISGRYTRYDLDNTEPDQRSEINRTLTTASIDTGLFFDRPTDDIGSVQTLEPRLFLLRVPFEDQSDIPVFDSSELDFNISQLFRENRFSGADRIADARQISAALTTRFIDGKTGREDLRASVGQIFYFDDRRVMLDNDTVETRSTSDYVAELSSELDANWRVRANIQYDPENSNTVRSSAHLSYSTDASRIINLGHRNVDTDNSAETEQVDFSFLWPIKKQWRVAGRWNYSLDSNKSIETMLGLEYESCCWAFRFATRRYISENGEDHDNSYYFQLVLKGLAPLGDNISELLGTGVLGYKDRY